MSWKSVMDERPTHNYSQKSPPKRSLDGEPIFIETLHYDATGTGLVWSARKRSSAAMFPTWSNSGLSFT